MECYRKYEFMTGIMTYKHEHGKYNRRGILFDYYENTNVLLSLVNIVFRIQWRQHIF